jgi:hypothetical protein
MAQAPVAYSEAIGRRTRTGTWEEQKVSTYRVIAAAIDEGRWDDAASLAHFLVDEANVCFTLYRQWIADLSAFLAEQGVAREEVDRANERIVAKLALADGTPWHARRHWEVFRTGVEDLVALIHRRQQQAALVRADEVRATWRQLHDRDVDHTYGLMHEVVTRLGEDAIVPMWDRVLLPLFVWRYEKFDIDKHPWDEALHTLMLVFFEAARGHLFGPGRYGDVELIETDDRFIVRFDPCGSGGRIVGGDAIEGTPPRTEPPYGWSVSEQPRSWNHFQRGVCHYCTHCIRLMEEWPIDRFGYPVRVVDPPVYDPERPERSGKCQYQMFKDPTAVPAEYYARVGRTRPQTFGSRALGAPELPPLTAGLPGAG